VGKVLIFNSHPEEREFLFKFSQQIGPVYVSPSLEKSLSLLNSMSFSLILVDAELADDPALKANLLASPCLILTGRSEDKLKEAIRRWPLDRFVDYILISGKPADLTRCQRILMTAQEYARLKSDVESLANSKESAEDKLRKASAAIKEISNTLSGSLVKELEKRIALKAQYIRFQKLKQNFENTLRKLYAANDVHNLLDIVYDIKDLVRAGGISLYIREENETLGKYLKPLVWDDTFPSHADFTKHVALFQAPDFASFVIRTGQELNISDVAQDERFSSRYRNHLRVPLQNILCSPIKDDEEVIGLLEVYNKSENDKVLKSGFNPEDQQILRGLSEHISLAITKLNLIQYDALTGLLRPDPFFEKVIQKIASQSKRRQETDCWAMVMGDVDWFKNYNDRNGHEAGNRLLRELAGVLKSAIREEDILCRYGGEEFLFSLTGVKNIEEATLLTERIRKNVEDHYFEFEEFQPRQNLTMSFGVTLFPPQNMEDGEIMTKAALKKIANEADIALAEAKEKRLSALKYNESMITKNKVCAFVRDKSAVMSKTTLLEGAEEKAFQEKRMFDRHFTSTLCIYGENGSHCVANTIDLSLGGAKISSKMQFPLATILDIFLILGNRANTLKGEVMYSKKASPNSAYFYTGLKFRDLSEEDKQLLQSYLLSLEKRDVAPN
jgi:diguanylate cyclase (GGDEF)-like protein